MRVIVKNLAHGITESITSLNKFLNHEHFEGCVEGETKSLFLADMEHVLRVHGDTVRMGIADGQYELHLQLSWS